jgi:hypothetical protein
MESCAQYLNLDRGGLVLPGRVSHWGRRSDTYESISRLLLLAAFSISGCDDPADSTRIEALAERYVDCLDAGASQGRRGIWPTAQQCRQSLVESSNLALAMLVAPNVLWHGLSRRAQENLIRRFSQDLSVVPTDNNWVMFPVVISAFLDSIGYEHPERHAVVERARRVTDQCYAGGGWYSDGPGRVFDYYNAWSYHFEGPLLAHLGHGIFESSTYVDRAKTFNHFLTRMIDDTGSPVYWGRSLTYRFAIASSFATEALLAPAATNLSTLGELWSRVVEFFVGPDGISKDGLLSVGWYGPDDDVAQWYSGAASPYWAYRSFAALLVPAHSAFWKASPTPKGPITGPPGDTVVGSHGYVASVSGGVAVLHNHGGDRQGGRQIAHFRDDPLYARRSYSSRTAPSVVGGLPDNSFVLTSNRRITHRGLVQPVATGSHWAQSRLTPVVPRSGIFAAKLRDYGRLSSIGPRMKAVHSGDLHEITGVLGSWAIHAYRITTTRSVDAVALTGWALPAAGEDELTVREFGDQRLQIANENTTVDLLGLLGFASIEATVDSVRSPFGQYSALPVLRTDATGAEIFIAASRICDNGSIAVSAEPPSLEDARSFLAATGFDRLVATPDRASSTQAPQD